MSELWGPNQFVDFTCQLLQWRLFYYEGPTVATVKFCNFVWHMALCVSRIFLALLSIHSSKLNENELFLNEFKISFKNQTNTDEAVMLKRCVMVL